MQNKRAIALIFLANTISGMAQGVSIISIPWYLSNVAEQQAFWSAAYMVITLAIIPSTLIFGTFIDRFDRKNIMVVISLTGLLLVGGISASGFHAGSISHWLVALVFMYTFLHFNIHYPNLYAFIQEISDKKDYKRLTSWIEIQGQTTTMLAGAAAAIMLEGVPDGVMNLFGLEIRTNLEIRQWAMWEIFALDAFTYFIAFLLFVMIDYKPVIRRNIEMGGIAERMRTGICFLRDQPRVLFFGLSSFVLFACILVLIFYVLPVYIAQQLQGSAQVFANAEMLFAIGSLVAGLSVHQLFRKLNPVYAISILYMLAVGSLLLNVFNTLIPLFFLASLVIGFTNAGTRVLRITHLYSLVPNEMFGRTGSIFNVMNVILRFSLILLFSTAIFHTSNHMIFAMLGMAILILLALAVMIWNYRKHEG